MTSLPALGTIGYATGHRSFRFKVPWCTARVWRVGPAVCSNEPGIVRSILVAVRISVSMFTKPETAVLTKPRHVLFHDDLGFYL